MDFFDGIIIFVCLLRTTGQDYYHTGRRQDHGKVLLLEYCLSILLQSLNQVRSGQRCMIFTNMSEV